MAAKKPDHDLTTTIHLGVRGLVSNSAVENSATALEKLSVENLAVLEKITSPDAMLFSLRGGSQGSRFLLSSEEATIGRNPKSDIFLNDVTVSRSHASISRSPQGKYVLRDCSSLNGTYVNSASINDKVLTDGDEIQLGKFVMIFFKAQP